MNSLGEFLKISKKGKFFIEVEIAESVSEKIRGLMFKEIEEERGLLMIFEKSKRHEVWMPFVPQDLGIFFLDNEKKIVDKKLAKKITLNPKSWQIYKPQKACKYVMECKPKKLDEVETGDKLEWKK